MATAALPAQSEAACKLDACGGPKKTQPPADDTLPTPARGWGSGVADDWMGRSTLRFNGAAQRQFGTLKLAAGAPLLLVFGGASARRGALWLAAGFGLVNAVSVDVLLTITWMLTIHMQKLTNYAPAAVGLSGAKATASAKFGPVLRRSCVVLALFAAGVGAGHYFCEACLDMAGFSTLFGAWYALIVLSHDQGRVGLDSLGKALLLNKTANPGLLDE